MPSGTEIASNPSPAPMPKRRPAAGLNGRQRAAIIVRVALNAGAALNLSAMSHEAQRLLVVELSKLKNVSNEIVDDVVSDFLNRIEQAGLTFPSALKEALDMIDGTISPEISRHIRKEAGIALYDDPWARVEAADDEALIAIIQAERTEIAAVILSKLKVSRAAQMLGRLSGDRARRIAFAISQTESVAPQVVMRIGQTIAEQLDLKPVQAFDTTPVDRVGGILNFSLSSTRDDVLEGLDSDDAEFADKVRRAIFTFEHIASRIDARFIPILVREVDQAELVIAMAGAIGKYEATRDFILENMSKRMAEQLREDIADQGDVKPETAEAAMTQVVIRIRELVDAGEIEISEPEERIAA